MCVCVRACVIPVAGELQAEVPGCRLGERQSEHRLGTAGVNTHTVAWEQSYTFHTLSDRLAGTGLLIDLCVYKMHISLTT